MNLYDKYYFEEYAKLSLIYLYDEHYSDLKGDGKESPDLQSYDLGLGVEVTRALSELEGQTMSIVQEYFGKDMSYEEIKKEVDSNYKHINGDLLEYNGVTVLTSSKGLQDFNVHIEEVKKSYIKKTKKLNNNYTAFKRNELYIFTFEVFDEFHVNSCFNLDLNIYNVNFDTCFLNCIDKIYVCDFTDKKINGIIKVDKLTLARLKREAMLVHHK